MLKHLALASLLSISIITVGHTETWDDPKSVTGQNVKKLELSGSTKLQNVEVDVLFSKGPLKFRELKVRERIEVEGPLNGSGLRCKYLKVKGPTEASDVDARDVAIFGKTELEKIKVNGETEIHGNLSISRGRLRDAIFYANDMTLDDTYADRIVIKGRNATLVLKGNTTISGDIVFEDGEGTVKKSRTAQINGKVRGAVVESMHRQGRFGGKY